VHQLCVGQRQCVRNSGPSIVQVVFAMSAIGPKQTCLVAPHMSAFGCKADMTLCGNPLLRSLLGVKRTWRLHCEMSASDPKRTLTASGPTQAINNRLSPCPEIPNDKHCFRMRLQTPLAVSTGAPMLLIGTARCNRRDRESPGQSPVLTLRPSCRHSHNARCFCTRAAF
jgi:hypothetical protein